VAANCICHMSPRRHTHMQIVEQGILAREWFRGAHPIMSVVSMCAHNAFEFAFLPVFSEPMELCGAPPLPQETVGI